MLHFIGLTIHLNFEFETIFQNTKNKGFRLWYEGTFLILFQIKNLEDEILTN